MDVDAAARPERSRSHRLFYAIAIAAWILFSLRAPDEDEGPEYVAGYITGLLAGTLAFALFVRLLYWLVRRGSVRFWSPWVFVLAAVLAFFTRLADLAAEEEALSLLFRGVA